MATAALDSPSKNDKILFWASFFTLIAAGMGFSLRNTGVKAQWGEKFGFTQTELGDISGGGLAGFGLTIIVLSFIIDKVGFRPLMRLAFVFHLLSAVVTLAAPFAFDKYGKDGAWYCLTIGMWLFAFGNGTCEAVINPLTATLFPRNKTHWLNILHAGWPLGLVLGALVNIGLDKLVPDVSWQVRIGIFLVPTFIYGAMMFGRVFPRSEADASGVSVGTMLLQFASPILLLLVLIHAMVGYVELGTDSWIQAITGKILSDPFLATILFIYTSMLMFTLRFFAGPIVHQISPVGLLFVSAIFGTTGLYLLSISTTVGICFLAATVYGIGKTFFWPTMLGVVSERYPKGGSLALGIMGGVGMLSAGLLGDPGIGYKQDFFAKQKLEETSKETYERYRIEKASNTFPILTKMMPDKVPAIAGLDNSKTSILEDYTAKSNAQKDDSKPVKLAIETDIENLKKVNGDTKELEQRLNDWKQKGLPTAKEDAAKVEEAKIFGARQALLYTAAVPATMAILYLLLILYYKAIGGYKPLNVNESH